MRRTGPQVLLGALLLMLMCVVSGRPQVFADTKAYYALGHEIATSLVGQPAVSSTALLRGHAAPPAIAAREMRLAYTVAATRSPYWSLCFYLLVALGSAWAYVAAQALLASATLWSAARAFGAQRAFLPITAVLACASTLPVFVMFLMPDLFTGLAIVAGAVLLFRHDATGRGERIALAALLAAAALFHTSNVMLLGGLGMGAFAISLRRRHRAMRHGALALFGGALVGAVGAFLYPAAVLAVRHEQVYAPPFLAARLIADGPGRALLRADCRRGDAWGMCRFADRPLDDVNQILWDDKPGTAVFQAADYPLRVRIISEQRRFVTATVSRYPLEVARTTAGNVAHLLVHYGTHEVLDDPTPRYRMPAFAVFASIVPGTQGCREGTASCASRLNIDWLDALIGAAMLASLAVIALLLAASRQLRARWLPAVLFLLAGYVLNAVICGALSGSAERYQSRIAWLVPMLALLIASTRNRTLTDA